MQELNPAEHRSMQRICTPAGGVVIVAADQRNSMKAVMNAPDGPESISTSDLVKAKRDLVNVLGNNAPAILLDPEVAMPQLVMENTFSRDTGIVIGMDASGYSVESGLRFTNLVEGISAKKLRFMGADAAKMLYYIRPDRQGVGSLVASQMRELADECAAESLLLIVEILTYKLNHETDAEYQQKFPDLVAEATSLAVECGAKMLKLPFPGSEEGCKRVHEAAAGVPWAILSAGVDHSTFLGQVDTALSNGCAGAMAGRSLWKDALAPSSQERVGLLTTRALPRLRELINTVTGATPNIG